MHSSSNIMVAICYHYDFWKFFLIALLYTYFWVIIIFKRMSYSKSYFIILCNIFIIFLALTIGWLFYIKRLAKCIFYGSTWIVCTISCEYISIASWVIELVSYFIAKNCLVTRFVLENFQKTFQHFVAMVVLCNSKYAPL